MNDKNFQRLKSGFNTEYRLNRHLDFKSQINKAKCHTGLSTSHLSSCQKEELLHIYIHQKIDISDEMRGFLKSKNPPFPINIIKETIELEISGYFEEFQRHGKLTKEEFDEIYKVAMQAEIENKSSIERAVSTKFLEIITRSINVL